MRRGVASAALLLFMPAARAGAQGIVGGRVVDDVTGAPLACIEAALLDSSRRRVAMTRVRTDGTFEFPAPERGEYRIAFLMSRHLPTESERMALAPTADSDRTYRAAFRYDTTSAAHVDSLAEGLWFREPGRPLGRTPRELGARDPTGGVLGRYAIGVDGRAVPGSIAVLQSTGAAFTSAFIESMEQARFITSRFPPRDPSCVMIVTVTTWGTGMQVERGRMAPRPNVVPPFHHAPPTGAPHAHR